MKKLLLLLITPVFIFSMCQKPKSRHELISAAQNLEMSKGIRKDTIILGFVFGMSRNQVENHFKKLLYDGKITMDNLNQYQYKIELPDVENVFATFYGEFFNDSLYSMTLRIEGNSQVKAELIQLDLSILFFQKHYNFRFDVPSILNKEKEDKIFIVGNQQVEISYPILSVILVNYTDYMIESRKNKFEEKNKEIKKAELIKDL